jgi:hypothetical protein
MTEGIGDPFKDLPFRQPSFERKGNQPEVDAGGAAHTHHTQLPSKLGQAPKARAEPSGVKSASGPHPQNVRYSARVATSPFWSSTSGPDRAKQHYEEGRGRRPWRNAPNRNPRSRLGREAGLLRERNPENSRLDRTAVRRFHLRDAVLSTERASASRPLVIGAPHIV